MNLQVLGNFAYHAICGGCDRKVMRPAPDHPLMPVAFCSESGKETIEHADSGYCPIGRYPVSPFVPPLPMPEREPAPETEAKPALKAKAEIEGPKRWAMLHERSRQPVADIAGELEWIGELADGLEACGCSAHWKAHLSKNPATADIVRIPELYIQWAINAHNAVNERLGKPIWGSN